MPRSHNSALPQHYGSLMPTVRDHDHNVHSHQSHRPSEEGWRTPTIEDADHPHNLSSSNNGNAAVALTDRLHQLQHRRRPLFHQGHERSKSCDSQSIPTMRLSWKDRIKHVTWAYFTLCMATGGIANVLSAVPYRFRGLETIGKIFMLLNIVFFIIIWAMLSARFYLHPYMFKASFLHPTESLFVPAVAVSFGTILINIVEYGFGQVGQWLNEAVLVLFWFDCALALVLSILIYFLLWNTQHFTIARMTPIWIFPAYPLLIIGPHAGNLASRLRDARDGIQVIVGGFTIQGIGFLVALTIYSAFVYRLMTQKLPPEPLRPAMFVSVGPSAFTVSGTISMAANFQKIFEGLPNRAYMDVPGPLAASILKLIANWAMLWLWGLAWWFFFISLLSNLSCLRQNHHYPFAMTWYSFIFPQTALTTATFQVGNAFDVKAIKIIGCVMTVALIVVWFIVVASMFKAVVNKQILWPEKGEDKSEGGFVQPSPKSHSAVEEREQGEPKDATTAV